VNDRRAFAGAGRLAEKAVHSIVDFNACQHGFSLLLGVRR
jgi:hypothetical protein